MHELTAIIVAIISAIASIICVIISKYKSSEDKFKDNFKNIINDDTIMNLLVERLMKNSKMEEYLVSEKETSELIFDEKIKTFGNKLDMIKEILTDKIENIKYLIKIKNGH